METLIGAFMLWFNYLDTLLKLPIACLDFYGMEKADGIH